MKPRQAPRLALLQGGRARAPVAEPPRRTAEEAAAFDAEMASAIAAGERDALHALYVEAHADVRRFARRMLGDDAAAEDVLHEVFVALPRAVRGWRRVGTLRSFVMAMAVNVGRHHLRASQRRSALSTRLSQEPEAAASAPDRQVERERLAEKLSRALEQLPIEQRIAFVLSEVEERPAAEGAAIVGVRAGTFRARVFLARRRLRALLQEVSS